MMFNNKFNFFIHFFILFSFIVFESKAVDEFDINLLNEKLNRLEEEISDIQKNLYAPEDNTSVKEKNDKTIPSKYQRRINKIENDFAKMNGKFEEIFFRLDQLQEKLNILSSDVDFRLSNTNDSSTGGLPLAKKDRSNEKDTIAYPKNTSDIDTSGGDTEILGTLKDRTVQDEAVEIAKNFQTPDDLFNYGKESLQNLNYSDAENAFRGFISKFPNDERIPNANYWLGESLFVRESYVEAVMAYGEVIKKHKKHKRAPSSLLKIGISFSNLEKKKESCDALNKILKQYPDTDQDVLKKTNFIIQQNSC